MFFSLIEILVIITDDPGMVVKHQPGTVDGSEVWRSPVKLIE